MADEALHSDRPLVDVHEDALGVAGLAQNLARALARMAPRHGLVMAIYGDWGTGKTTLINFMRSYLEKHEPDSEKPIIVAFNPWQFSSHQDLIRSYFNELSLTLSALARAYGAGTSFAGRLQDFTELAEKLAEFGESLGDLPGWVHAATGGLTNAAALGGSILERREKPLETMRAEIEDLLSKQDRKIVVIIDDIDRLTKDEVRDIFRMVKAVANFPNVIYLLAFDKNVASRALEADQSLSGSDYLEKIVQFDITLPRPSYTSVFEIFSRRLEKISNTLV